MQRQWWYSLPRLPCLHEIQMSPFSCYSTGHSLMDPNELPTFTLSCDCSSCCFWAPPSMAWLLVKVSIGWPLFCCGRRSGEVRPWMMGFLASPECMAQCPVKSLAPPPSHFASSVLPTYLQPSHSHNSAFHFVTIIPFKRNQKSFFPWLETDWYTR